MAKKQNILTSPRLEGLIRDFSRIEKREKILLIDKIKLMKYKEQVKSKITKEKKILTLKRRIERLKGIRR